MKLNKIFYAMTVVAAAALSLNACGGSGFSSTAASQAAGLSFTGQNYSEVGTKSSNTMTISVNGTGCGTNSTAYPNLPCVSVTLCTISDPTNCQTIDNLLLDTGSFGLRVFKSAITSTVLSGLVPVTSGTGTLAECTQYGDGSSQWGQVENAYVQLGGEPKVGVPIQVIDYNYYTPASPCTSANSTPDTGPSTAGFNGILGVGHWAQDCGSDCTTDPYNQVYFTCQSGDCSAGAVVSLNAQVTNPVSALDTDNNGVILNFPSVSSGGASSATGTLTIGVRGTLPTTPTVVSSSSGGFFYSNQGTSFNASTYTAGFIDSGSNFYYLPGTPTTACSSTSGASGFFCPASTVSLSYTNTAYPYSSGGVQSVVTLSVANAVTQLNTGNYVFGNVAGSSGGLLDGYVDYGLPFFFGKTVYVGIYGTTSSIGSGAYNAY
jgi:hypothetical protein